MMCAGVQNVSRPMDMCQEMSHGPPIIPLTTPATMHQIVHGTDSTRAPTPAPARAVIGGLAMCCPNGIDCPIAINPSAAPTRGIFLAVPRVYTPRRILRTSRPATSAHRRHFPSQIIQELKFYFSPAELHGTSWPPFRLYH